MRPAGVGQDDDSVLRAARAARPRGRRTQLLVGDVAGAHTQGAMSSERMPIDLLNKLPIRVAN